MPGGPIVTPIDPSGDNPLGPFTPGGPGGGGGESIPDSPTDTSYGLGPMPILVVVLAKDMTSLKVTGKR